MSYESPISIYEIFVEDIKSQFDEQLNDQIVNAVVHVGVNVDKDELIKALGYDREQYNKGFMDGMNYVKSEIIRCKDCVYKQGHFTNALVKCGCGNGAHHEDFFCADGERRE